MYDKRVIPILLLQGNKLVKTVGFKSPRYIGDPVNTAKIFNDKRVDEMVLFDITASRNGREPNYHLLEDLASECFMPLCYGGGICSVDIAKRVLQCGIEKISVSSEVLKSPHFAKELVSEFGSSTVVVTINIKNFFLSGYKVATSSKKKSQFGVIEFSKMMENMGVGELIINDIDRDGTMGGYNLEIMGEVAESVSVPVIACGGAGCVQDIHLLLGSVGVAGAGAGSCFVYRNKEKSILISYVL